MQIIHFEKNVLCLLGQALKISPDFLLFYELFCNQVFYFCSTKVKLSVKCLFIEKNAKCEISVETLVIALFFMLKGFENFELIYIFNRLKTNISN